jgi:hypothetical protein
VIEGLNFWLLPSLTSWGQALGFDVDFSSWNMLIFGVLLVAMMLYRPQGFLPSKARQLNFDDEPERAGVQHYPAGLTGPLGDETHGMHMGAPVMPMTDAVPMPAAGANRAAETHAPPPREPARVALSLRRWEPATNPFRRPPGTQLGGAS